MLTIFLVCCFRCNNLITFFNLEFRIVLILNSFFSPSFHWKSIMFCNAMDNEEVELSLFEYLLRTTSDMNVKFFQASHTTYQERESEEEKKSFPFKLYSTQVSVFILKIPCLYFAFSLSPSRYSLFFFLTQKWFFFIFYIIWFPFTSAFWSNDTRYFFSYFYTEIALAVRWTCIIVKKRGRM